MAKISELVEDIAEVLNEPRETVNAYARALIDDGLLPKSRGRAFAEAEPLHIVRLFLATALAPKIKDASKFVSQYCDLISGGIPVDHPRFNGVDRAGESIADIWSVLMSANASDEARTMCREATIEVIETWPEINITFANGDIARFTEPGNPGDTWKGYTKRSTIISGRAFVFLGVGKGRDYHESVSE